VPDVDATIAALSEHPESVALLADFDGTLAPIVERPEDAVAHPEAVALLGALGDVLGRVGIVSGRPVEFLARNVPVDGLVYAGLYGLEVLEHGERRIDPRVAPYTDAVAAVADEADARLPGVLVERKAGITVTLHWRMCPEREAEIREVGSDLASRFGLDAPQRGRMALELRPPVPVDKGSAVATLVDGFATAAFAGDDAGDLPAFSALARAAADGRVRRAWRIGVLSAEAPPELAAAVDVVVDGPEGFVALLRGLVARVRE
jgi:trehalose 6-phosphate phosphatase